VGARPGRAAGPEVIAVSQLGEELLEDCPVPVATGDSELMPGVLLEVVSDAVVVEQRVIHVDKTIGLGDAMMYPPKQR
jgi:hypothetical protein